MSSIDVKTRIIRAFEGPRHDRLYSIWDAIAEYQPECNLEWFPNPNGWAYSHGEAFNAIWEEERDRPSRYLLLTEADFLPDLQWKRWFSPKNLGPDAAAQGVAYVTRDPDTMEAMTRNFPGGWWILIDKTLAPRDLEFRGTPDPGNQLVQQFRAAGHEMYFYPGRDCYPRHYGREYDTIGEHLFWSRHLHDAPNLVVAGCRLGDVQEKHDRAVEAWIKRQPPDFQTLLKESM